MSLAVEQLMATTNGRAVERADIPELSEGEFRQVILEGVASGQRVAALFGMPGMAEGTVQVHVVLADDHQAQLGIATTTIRGGRFQALTPRCTQVHLFEREMAEQFGLHPVGHPWLKPVRFERSEIGVTSFYRVEGEEIHEVAVGPVHAGIIEPGHFRFQCHGEEVLHLEIALGYQHRGIERAMMGGPHNRSVHYAETLAGDTTVGHCTAYCQAIEALAGCQSTARAQSLRGVALELERLANHVGDLGALANDVGFLPTASYCGRIRGDFLNMTALLCGGRFGRGMVRPGGVGFNVDQELADELLSRLAAAREDCRSAIELLWDSPSVMARLEETGRVSVEMAEDLGLVGPAARACGLARDIRHDHPLGIYCFSHIPVGVCDTGDVFARAYVRWLEVQRSIAFVEEQLGSLPAGAVQVAVEGLAPGQIAVALVEGWRGEICHVALTDPAGRLERYKVVDPSFHNWTGLAMALRGQQISDFPLCNKSFNLSYCGHDL